MHAVLEVQNLSTRFATPDGEVLAADAVDFSIGAGESLGVVGESGSGKTQIFLSIMGLLAKNGRSTGRVRYRGPGDPATCPPRSSNRIRGDKVAMIFQDPMTSLNPYHEDRAPDDRGAARAQGHRRGRGRRRRIAHARPGRHPRRRAPDRQYPHEFSGGMRQRVMIAMALLCQPDLLIADEPTTALDVTVQAQILELLGRLQREFGMAIVLITHDLGVVAGLSDRVMVMYAGRMVETARRRQLFDDPQHPYTQGLLLSMPRLDETVATRARDHPRPAAQPAGAAAGLRRSPTAARYVVRALPPSSAPGAASPAARPRKACHLERLP